MELQYDQNIPPSQKLQVHNFDKYQLSSVTVKKLPSQGLTLKYDEDDEYIAIGCRSGTRLLYSLAEHKIVQRFQCINETAVTCLRWRPSSGGKHKILATADADGNLNYWHVPSMKKIFSLKQEDNSIFCLDFQPNSEHFATAGKDCNVRIYDQETKTVTVTCKSAQWNNIGHDNRIFCVKYIDPNTLISGGWDSVVHIWDLRQGKSIRHFLGPHISGDSLDYQDGKILAGCYSAKDQLQIWNFTTCKKIEQIDWTNNIDQAQYLYTASYSKHSLGMFGAGSTGKNSEVRLYKQVEQGKHKLVNKIQGLNQGCFSLDFSRKHQQIAFTTAHHGFYIFDYKKK